MLETLRLQLLPLLVSHLHFLNLRPLLCTYTLKLNCSAFVLHFRNAKSKVYRMLELLNDVIESQFNHYLNETGICLASVNRLRIPYHVKYLSSLTLLVIVLADTPKTEWSADADI
jgi:hypothetical protein